MRAWLTGSTEPDSFSGRVLRVPNVDWFSEAVNGAIVALTEPTNWEEYGTYTPEEAAELGMIMWSDYLDSIHERVGTIFYSLLEEVPDGAHELDGSTLSNADTSYPILWDRIAETFKSGTSIVLPDWRGKFPIVPGGSINEFDTGGDFAVSLEVANMPKHEHSISVFPTPYVAGPGPGASVVVNAPVAGTTGSTGSGDEFEYMPEYCAPRVCIWLE